jgi:cytohesin
MTKTIALSLLALLTFFSACKPQEQAVNPDGAKQMLKLRGYTTDDKGFFQAIKAGDVGALRTFQQAQIDIAKASNEKGETPLTYAIVNSDAKTAKALIELTDINARDKDGNSPLHLAYWKNKDDIFKALIEKGANVNVPGKGNQPVLQQAAMRGDMETVKQLLEKGADVNALDDFDTSALILACSTAKPNMEIVKLLLEKGARVNHREKNKASALVNAGSHGNVELIKFLLDSGADTKIEDEDGNSAYDWAVKNKNTEAAAALKGK